MGAHQTVSPIDAVDRIVFRVSGVEEPQHALESPSRIRRVRELAPILLVSGRPVGRVDCEPRGHADGVGAALKCTHTRGKAPRLQPIVGADPAKERAARGLEHAPHVLVRTDVDLIDAQPDAPVGTRVILEHLDRSVIRGVVADDELEIGEVLRQDRFDAPLDDSPGRFVRRARSKALESSHSPDPLHRWIRFSGLLESLLFGSRYPIAQLYLGHRSRFPPIRTLFGLNSFTMHY